MFPMAPPKRKRPLKSKDDSDDESDWEDDNESSKNSSNEDDDNPHELEEPKEPSPTKRSLKKPAPKRQNKGIVADSTTTIDDTIINALPTHARLTQRGGYTHTNTSRLAISRANLGKSPWNKGKIRSGTDKAKISAGVKARNRAILLEGLQELKMTQDEYEEKKKQVKYLRERVRVAKAKRVKRVQEKKQRQQAFDKAALDEGGDESDAPRVDLDDMRDETRAAETKTATANSSLPPPPPPTTTEFDLIAQHHANDADTGAEEGPVNPSLPSRSSLSVSIFSNDYHWTPHPLDSSNNNNDTISCPMGGPGGLICCPSCTARYSCYLSSTFCDLERQTIALIGRNAKEIMTFMDRATKRLTETNASIRMNPKAKPLLAKKKNAVGGKKGK
jgi:hypothetical protein